MSNIVELAIIGAGPAGMSAAIAAREHGIDVVVLDEQGAPGGQIYRNVEAVTAERPNAARVLGEDYVAGAPLARAFRECGARYSPYTSVWELSAVGRRADHEAPVELGLLRDGFAEMVYAHCVIAATGAQERAVPAPGATLPGVIGAGDGAHILGAEAAVDSGRIAALEAAHRLGRVDAQRRDALAKPHRASLARHRRFREFLDLAFEPGAAALRPSDPAVTVCRCEEVTVAEIERVIAHGCPGPNQAKAFTRCGMGPCQGRMCATAVSEIFAEHQRTHLRC